MDKYYYLVSSLPYLKFGDDPPISGEAFTGECGKWLSDREMKTLRMRSLAEWQTFDNELRAEIARVRKAVKEKKSYKTTPGIKNVMEQINPLLMERAFERLRWDFIEDKKAVHHFDMNAVVLYSLELEILERLAVFDKDRGEKIFYDMCEVVYD